jgi:hypothetical protein
MPVDIITKSVADVILEVERIFGDESGVQITSSDIVRWINAAQLEVAMRNPEILPAVALVNSVAGQADYPLLANIPNVLTIQSIHFNGVPVKHMQFQEAEEYLMKGTDVFTSNPPTDSPMFWYERAGVVTFYPAPSTTTSQTIKVYFNKRPETVNPNSLLSLSDHYYNGIVAFVLEQAYLLDENPQLAGVVAAKFDSAVTRMAERTETQSDYYPFITAVDDY